MEWTRCLAPIQEKRRCPAPILVEPTIDATAVVAPSTDNEVDEVPRNDTGVVEVLHRFSWSGPVMRQHWRYPAPIIVKTRCLAPIEQWRRCPAQIGVDNVPRTDRAVICPAPILWIRPLMM